MPTPERTPDPTQVITELRGLIALTLGYLDAADETSERYTFSGADYIGLMSELKPRFEQLNRDLDQLTTTHHWRRNDA